ncbi:MAG TPA: hypothetical protein VK980_19305 [Sphingomonas sp.]|nr:hypothetical protein [Sphingomonas sp.]
MIRNMRWLVVTGSAILLSACSGSTGGNASDNTAASMPPAPTAITNAVVQPLPTATPTGYPPCSATVKDHCVEP